MFTLKDIYIYTGICTEYVNVCDILMPSLGGNRSESMPLFLSLTKQPVPFSDLQLLPAWNISNLIPKWQRLDLRELSAINRDSWLCKSIDVIQLSSASSIEFAQFDGLMELQCRCTLLLGLASKKSNQKIQWSLRISRLVSCGSIMAHVSHVSLR